MTVTVYNFTCLGIFSVQQFFFVLLKSVLPTKKKKKIRNTLAKLGPKYIFILREGEREGEGWGGGGERA